MAVDSNETQASNVKLHPMVLLTITDYVTRHTLTKSTNAIFGVILGDRNGPVMSLRHAFECKAEKAERQPNSILPDAEWMAHRITQFQDVHKAPSLEPVAAFVVEPSNASLDIYAQGNLSVGRPPHMLLVFHPDLIANDTLQTDQLPITIYAVHSDNETSVYLKAVNYEIETDEAEFVGLSYVASGAPNARAVVSSGVANNAANTLSVPPGVLSPGRDGTAKGKAKAVASRSADVDATSAVYEEELIAAITTQYNAVKMLKDRLDTIHAYLRSLSVDTHLSDPSLPYANLSQSDRMILRNISSLLARIPLLSSSGVLSGLNPQPHPHTSSDSVKDPASRSTSTHPADIHKNDSTRTEDELNAYTNLLTTLTTTLASFSDLDRKYRFVSKLQHEKRQLSSMKEMYDNNPSGPAGSGTGSFGPGKSAGTVMSASASASARNSAGGSEHGRPGSAGRDGGAVFTGAGYGVGLGIGHLSGSGRMTR